MNDELMVDFCPKGKNLPKFLVAGVPHKTAGFVGWLIVSRSAFLGAML